MACYLLTAIAGNGSQSTRLILDVVPLNAVALLGITAVFLHTKTLAVEHQFHLFGISICI